MSVHVIQRSKLLENDIYELIFTRDNISFKPVSSLFIRGLNNERREIIIASGAKEPWIRVLLNNKKDLWVNDLINKPKKSTIFVDDEPKTIFPELINENEDNLVFIVSELGISSVLSYCSTFPDKKVRKILYKTEKNGVNTSWFTKYQNIITENENFENLLKKIPIKNKNKYYLSLTNQETSKTLEYLENKGIKLENVHYINSINNSLVSF